MDITRVARSLRLYARLLDLRRVDNVLVRTAFRAAAQSAPLPLPLARGVRIHTVDGPDARVRIYTPQPGTGTPENTRPRAALLWIHGGGLVVGAARQDDPFCTATAAELGIIVVSAEYRLAPEHRYPAAIDDVFAAWQWLTDHADDLGVDPDRLAIGGESAGGGLAACLVQRVHDSGGVQPAAQWLYAPMLDDRTAVCVINFK